MTAQQSGKGKSFLPPKVLRSLLQQQPTPFYLYDAAGLQDACRKLQEAFSWNAGFQVFFPVRMNPNPAVLTALSKAGCGALCAGETELLLAKRAGLSGADIVYAPMAFSMQPAAAAAKLGAQMLLDGAHALAPQSPAQVLLSVNPGGSLQQNGLPVWKLDKCKTGMDKEHLYAMCRLFAAHAGTQIGLAMFLRDQETEPTRFYAAAELLFSLAARIKQTLGIEIRQIFLSGGLGARYRASDPELDLAEVSLRVKESYEGLLGTTELKPAIFLAPGRWLAAKHGVLVTRVLAVKDQPSPLVILDADCAQFLREIAFGASHRLSAPLVPENRKQTLVRAAGALSDLRDHFSGTFVLPELKLGECVVVHDVGADGRSFASNYGGSLGCAEFLQEPDGTVRCIRKAQTAEQLLSAFDEN